MQPHVSKADLTRSSATVGGLRGAGSGRLRTARRFRRGRNYINVGDLVRVRAVPGKRDGFKATVRAIRVDSATGEVAEVEVFGGRGGRAMVRTFVPERIERLAQTRDGVPMERRP